MTDQATPAKVRLTDGLGPLPDGAGYIDRGFRYCGDQEPGARYTSDQMRAYAAEQVAAERERWEEAMRKTWRMVDPLRPAGTPGSYARGQDNGIVAALETLRQNVGPNVRSNLDPTARGPHD